MLNGMEGMVKSHFLTTSLVKNSHRLILNARGQVVKKEWQYILNCFKIVIKIRKTVGDIKEFSETPNPKGIPQPDLSANEVTDILIFNMPEIISPKKFCLFQKRIHLHLELVKIRKR